MTMYDQTLSFYASSFSHRVLQYGVAVSSFVQKDRESKNIRPSAKEMAVLRSSLQSHTTPESAFEASEARLMYGLLWTFEGYDLLR